MWQVPVNLLGPDWQTTVTLDGGLTFLVGLDDQINRDLVFTPSHQDYIHEPQTLRLALSVQTTGATTIIAGAHIGYHALHLAQSNMPAGGNVIAFEPMDRYYARLVRSRQLSHLDNLTTERMALDIRSQETVKFYLAGTNSSLLWDTGSFPYHEVQAISLDDFATEKGLDRAGLIFLDIEGNELNVLMGAPSLLRSAPDLILEVLPAALAFQNRTPTDLYDFLFLGGYSLFYIHDDYGSTHRGYDPTNILLRPIRSYDPSFPTDSMHFNIFATRNPETLDRAGITVLQHLPIGEVGLEYGAIPRD